jgi:hypothetical protein
MGSRGGDTGTQSSSRLCIVDERTGDRMDSYIVESRPERDNRRAWGLDYGIGGRV